MQPADFTERRSGRLVNHARGYWAFVPNPLPPPLDLTWILAGEISAADRAVSELAGLTRTLLNWLSFFLRGVTEQAGDAIRRSEKLLRLWQSYRTLFQSARSSALLLKLVDQLFHQPYLTVSQAKDFLNVTHRAADLNVKKLVEAGILWEQANQVYNRVFVAHEVMSILDAPDVK